MESKKIKQNLLSAISNTGKLRYTIYPKMSPETLIRFMHQLVRNTTKKVFLILDNLRTHHAKKVKKWLEKHKDKIALFYLPPYSPEYNPDEFLNSDIKRDIGNRQMPHSEKDIEKNIRAYMKNLRANKNKIIGFFKAPCVNYAK